MIKTSRNHVLRVPQLGFSSLVSTQLTVVPHADYSSRYSAPVLLVVINSFPSLLVHSLFMLNTVCLREEDEGANAHKVLCIQNSVAYTLWLNSKQPAPFVARCLLRLPHETKLDAKSICSLYQSDPHFLGRYMTALTSACRSQSVSSGLTTS